MFCAMLLIDIDYLFDERNMVSINNENWPKVSVFVYLLNIHSIMKNCNGNVMVSGTQ